MLRPDIASDLHLCGAFGGIRTPNLLIRILSDAVSGGVRESQGVTLGDHYRCGYWDRRRTEVPATDRWCSLRTMPMFSKVFSGVAPVDRTGGLCGDACGFAVLTVPVGLLLFG